MTVTIEAWPLRDPGLQPPAVSRDPNFKYEVQLGPMKHERFINWQGGQESGQLEMERPVKAVEQQSLYVTQALVSCLQCMITTPQGKCLEKSPKACLLPQQQRRTGYKSCQ